MQTETQPTPVPTPPPPRTPRKPGRPAVYKFDKPESELSEKERKQKIAIEKRRARQNKSYHRRKKIRKAALAAAAATTSSSTPTVPHVVPSPIASTSWSTSPSSTSPTIPQTLTIPKLLSGFAQNPLDLLATAGGSLGPAGAETSKSEPSVSTSTMGFVGARDSTMRDQVLPVLGMTDVNPSTDGFLPEVGSTLDIDASAGQIDISSFPVSVSKHEDDDHEDATDVLVNSALVAAKEYANNSMNLKDAMDREIMTREVTGIKQIVFDNLRTKYNAMKKPMQDALRHFIIFPRTFNLRAAAAVAGLKESQLVVMQGMIENMIQSNFIVTDNGRYELMDAARLFLNEDPTVLSTSAMSGTFDVAQQRYIGHYRTQLSRLQDDKIHKIGWLRENAMALFDTERENMEFSEYLLRGRPVELREFLSAGITVMRYCVSAANREHLLRKALMDDETSTENILLQFGNGNPLEAATSTSDSRKSNECDKSHKARLQLALSEAYFDQLKAEDAEKPLLQALKIMGDLSPKCSRPSSSIVDSVLVLLLLSYLRLSANRIKEARILCVKALKILAEAGLGRSTFGINAMSNLVTIYLEEGQLEKAKSVASRLLDTLNTMRYTGMPIYADALGVCAMVCMAEQKYGDAERQFGTALETVSKWGSKDWTGIPVQHCMDLDIWLLEGLAEAIKRQGRTEEAGKYEQRALEERENRKLPKNSNVPDYLQFGQQESICDSLVIECRPKLRHLY